MSQKEFEPTVAPTQLVPHVDRDKTENNNSPGTPAPADVVDRVVCRAGDDSCAQAHASTLSRSTASGPASVNRSLLQLQRQYGNRYVERVLSLSQGGVDRQQQHDVDRSAGDVSPNVESAIQQERGGGHGLDTGVRRQMESSLGADFSGVRIHTDQRADSLNRALSARAFTTGHDIFFREGAYQPGGSIGRELIAHELTHVVQQNGDTVRRAMSVSQPGDPHEVEAEQTARAVMQQEHVTVSKQDEKDEGQGMMASRCVCDSAQRQPEAVKGKDEDEEKKKHLSTALERSVLSRQFEENEQTE